MVNLNYTLLAGGYSTIITALSFNPSSPNVTILGTSDAGDSPSWLTLHPTIPKLVYAVNELTDGLLLAFSIGQNGALTKLDQVTTDGNGPAFASALKSGKEVAAMNYGDGTGTIIPLSPDGLTFATHTPPLIKFNANVSHPHEVLEYGSELLIPDLGADKIWRLTKEKGLWGVRDFQTVPTGSGPRHGVIIGNILYILTEEGNSIIAQTIPPLGQGSTAKTLATVNVLPTDVADTSLYFAGELVTSSGYLYASNRNTGTVLDPRGDSLAIVQTKPQLKVVKQVFTGLKNIRGVYVFGDCDQYIIAGGKETGGIVVYEVVDGGRDLKLLARNTAIEPTTTYVWVK